LKDRKGYKEAGSKGEREKFKGKIINLNEKLESFSV
jgi:spore coat protein CotF